jgi:5-oxoprolinase (ATP-hydrolysing)
MRHVLANAEESVRRLLDRLDDGEFDYPMDNGAHVRVAIRIDRKARSAVFDFTGTASSCPTISTRLTRSSERPRSTSCAR